MHRVIMGRIVPFIVFLVSVGGCLGEDEADYGGMGLTFMHENPEEDPIYYKVWSNEYPDDYVYPDGSVGPPGLKGGCGGWQGHSGFCTQTVLHCSTPQKPHRDYGNYLPEVYLEVRIYELETSLGGEETAGEEIESKRWDDLECFKGYTLVLTQGPHIELYRCNDCRDQEQRDGLEPLEPSGQ